MTIRLGTRVRTLARSISGWKGEGVVVEDRGNTFVVLKDGFEDTAENYQERVLLLRSQVREIKHD
jgi:hypothetical protein